MKQKLRLFFVGLFIIPILSLGQSAKTVSGYIKDSKTGIALQNSAIYFPELKTGVNSNHEGFYKIENLTASSVRIQVKYIGYQVVDTVLNFQNAETYIKFDVFLKMEIKELLGVEIVNNQANNSSFVSTTLKKTQIEEASVRDIGELMRIIPNVQAVRKGGANLDPVIRGFKFDQLNIQIDNGMTIEGGCPNRMDPTTSHIEAEDIEAIEVLKGPFALRYGPVMGGVVNLLSLNPRPFEKFEIHVKSNMGYESNWNGNRQHISVLGGNQHVFFTVTANNSLYRDYEDGNGTTVPSQFRKFGATAKIGAAITKNHTVVASYSEFYARNISFPALMMDERTDNTKLYSLDYKGVNISKTVERIDMKLYRTNVDHTMDNYERSNADTAAALSNIIAERTGGRLEAKLSVFKGNLFVGSDFYQIQKDGERDKIMIGQMPTIQNMIPAKYEDLWNNASINNNGFFAEFNRHFGSWDVIVAGRLDLNSAESDSIILKNTSNVSILRIVADSTKSDYTNFSFSAGISKYLSENFNLAFYLGRGTRSPNMLERFIIQLPVGLDNFEYIGNPLLKPEINNEFDISLKYNKFAIGSFEVTGFYSYIQDFIDGVYLPKSVVMPLTLSVYGVKKFENTGDASMFGYEFGYKSPIQYKFQASVTAAFTKGYHHEDSVYIFDASNNAIDRKLIKNDPIAEIPPLNIYINLSYNLFNNKLVPKFTYRYIGKQEEISQALYEIPSTDFSILGFSLTYKHSQNLSIVGGVSNLLDEAYYEHLNRRVLGTSTRLYEPGRVFYANFIYNL